MTIKKKDSTVVEESIQSANNYWIEIVTLTVRIIINQLTYVKYISLWQGLSAADAPVWTAGSGQSGLS